MTPRPPAPARLLTRPRWKPASPQPLGRLECPARCWRQAGPTTPRAPTTQSTRDAGRPPRVRTPSLLAAALVLWAGPALGQTLHSITHTGSATVVGSKVQVEEGGASTTFQIDLQDDFVTNLQAAHPEMARTGARIAGIVYFFRDSSDVTWTTSGSGFADRTGEFEVSHNGTALRHRYSAASPTSSFPTSREERIWFYVPLGSNNGESSSFTTDLATFEAAFPITFSIKAETDTPYEVGESIRVAFALNASGSQATPTFSAFQVGAPTLAFELVNPLPDPTGKPTTPTNLTATPGKGAVALTWDAVDATSSNTNLVNDLNITKHQVRLTTDNDITNETWNDIPNSGYGGVNATTYTIGSLTDGTEYTFQVRAVNGCTTTAGCGESDPATAIMATPDADALAQPTGLMANAGNTEIALTWTDPGDPDILYYEYEQREGSAAFGAWTEIPGSTATTTSYRSTGLTNGIAYSYRIRARTNVETSLASDAVTATPRGVPPAAPVLTATPRNGRRHPELAQPRRRQHSEIRVSIQDRHRGLSAVADRTGAGYQRRHPADSGGRSDQRHPAYLPHPGGKRGWQRDLERGDRHARGRRAGQAHRPDYPVGFRRGSTHPGMGPGRGPEHPAVRVHHGRGPDLVAPQIWCW